MGDYDYDVLVIGSGFGGSVTALRLTEKGYRVGVFESAEQGRRGLAPGVGRAVPAPRAGGAEAAGRPGDSARRAAVDGGLRTALLAVRRRARGRQKEGPALAACSKL